MFWRIYTILMHLGPFGFLAKLHGKRAELMQKFVPRSHVRIFATNAPDPPHLTLNSCFGAFRTIWVHLGPVFALQHSAQNGSTGVKVRATKSRRNFSQ